MSSLGPREIRKLPTMVSIAVALGGVIWLLLGPWASGVHESPEIRLISDSVFLLFAAAFSYFICLRLSHRDRSNLSEIQANKEKYEAFIANSTEAIWRIDLKEPISTGLPTDDIVRLIFERGIISECNQAVANMYGCANPSAMIGLPLTDFLNPNDQGSVDYLRTFVESGFRLNDAESEETDLHGNRVHFLNNLSADTSTGYITHAWGMQRDITKQRQSEAKVLDQLKRLVLLTQIDRSILGGSRFEHTVSETVAAVKSSPFVADVYITPSGEIDPWLGENPSFAIFETWKQEAIENQNLYYVNHPSDHGCQGVGSYLAIPFSVSNTVIGVIEVVFETENQCEPECLTFFEMVAAHLSVAYENAVTFENLAKTTREMQTAYDATLRGWVKALDLRDKETEGHSQRVTQMTLELAIEMGIEGSALDHIHRGALLHDIGKIGIPDGVLLKPGPLSPDEYKLMQTHPVLAYEWLKPIEFLHPALDIPYSHHEKWDGSGYPQGLAGSDIPVAARIFAIVDVFDALTSDRPYKKAMPEHEAMTIIREQCGRHFDPEVCAAFERLMAKRQIQNAA